MRYDFITIGGATRDVSFFTDQGVLLDNRRDILRQQLLAFEYGAKIKVDKFHYSFGGGAANAAVCLSNFGFKTACLTSIGDDETGSSIIENLKNKKIDIRLVRQVKNMESGTSFILVSPAGERIIFGSRGANRNMEIDNRQLAALAKADNINISSLSGKWENNLKKIFSIFDNPKRRKFLPKIYWNPGSSQYKAGLKKLQPFLRHVAVLSLNKDEAIELVMSSSAHRNLTRTALNNTDNLLKIIKSFGPEIVVITMGADGVKAFDGQKIYFQKIKKEKKRVDTTGVGDVFNSTLSAGLVLFDGDIKRALLLGTKNAAAKVANLGAQNGLLKLKDLKINS